MPITGESQMGCCLFLQWPSSSSHRGYRALAMDGYESSEDESAVRVVVGKERRVFLVDPFVLEKDPFRVLMETVSIKERRREGFSGKVDAIFVDVDAILFEHMLWLVYDDCSSSSSSLLQLNLKEIIEFYSQDS